MHRSRAPRMCAVVCAVVLLAATACGSSGTSSTAVAARLGDLEVIHPFLPDPASPSVAAVYLTVRNTGGVADQLVSVSSPVASSSMLMTENANGTMGALVNLPIPAHGEASLTPGHDHVMLDNPTTGFKVGQEVTVTLRFARAGTLAVEVPVVPLSDIVNDDGGTTGMSGMPGMNGT